MAICKETFRCKLCLQSRSFGVAGRDREKLQGNFIVTKSLHPSQALYQTRPYVVIYICNLLDIVPGNRKTDLFGRFFGSTAPWDNSGAWSDKIRWIKKYFGNNENSVLHKKLILTHHKNLNNGDILIDDRTKNGADKFCGEFILFGSEKYPDWNAILKYLI